MFFQGYMGTCALVAAALPVPTMALRLIPTYQFQRHVLATFTTLFCFLILAYVYYSRHQLARLMFPEHSQLIPPYERQKWPWRYALFWRYFIRVLPLLLIIFCLICFFKYQTNLTSSVAAYRARERLPIDTNPDARVLATSNQSELPEAGKLMLYYLGIFMLAEAAFALMAIKDFLQETLHLDESELLRGPKARAPDPQAAAREEAAAASTKPEDKQGAGPAENRA